MDLDSAISDLSVNVVCFGGVIWCWSLLGFHGTTTSTTSPSIAAMTTTTTLDNTPLPHFSSFVTHYLLWHAAMVIVLNVNRLLHVFVMFVRARALVSAVAACDALAKTAKGVVVEVVVFLSVYFLFNVILIMAVFFTYLW